MEQYRDQKVYFEEVCRGHGLKITHQRLEIYKFLLRSTKHPTAEGLYSELVRTLPTLSLDTVYRTLGTFVELGLVKRVETVGHQTRFEANMEQHHHFFCDQCGRLIDFSWPSFDGMRLPEELGDLGQVRQKNVILHGRCTQCILSGKGE